VVGVIVDRETDLESVVRLRYEFRSGPGLSRR